MAKMKAVQGPKTGADFEIVEREIPQPGAGHVRIHVQACGICHSDVITKEGLFPGITYPRVPGHEVAGVIDELGSGVKEWQKGQRVGLYARVPQIVAAALLVIGLAASAQQSLDKPVISLSTVSKLDR